MTAARALCPVGTQGGPCSRCCDAVAGGIAQGKARSLPDSPGALTQWGGQPATLHAVDEAPPPVCRRPSASHERMGVACPECGHTNLIHPQPIGNPSVDACRLCELEAVIRAARA